MYRLIRNYFQRWRAYRRLDKYKPKNLDAIVREYIDAGNRCMEDLCDALCMTPEQLYYSVSDREKCNVRLNLRDENREALVRYIIRRTGL